MTTRTGYKIRRATYRITSLPRRLFYKTKRIVTRPGRRRKTRNYNHTTNPNTTTRPTTRRHPRLFGGFDRRRTAQPRTTTKRRRRGGIHLFGLTIKKDPHY
jgi:hypothetical protein